ncbi:MAG: hypothetical protein ACI4GZ_06185 [Ruminococcus sp.]
MNDKKFREKYKQSVDSIKLPYDYRDTVLLSLRTKETSDLVFSDINKRKSKDRLRLAFSLAAAALVLAVGLSAVFSLRLNTAETREVRLCVASATSLRNISGAKIVFKNTAGEFLTNEKGETLTAVTDENGIATATVPAAEEVSAYITMNGYIPIERKAESGNYYISPVMNENTYRAVLTWSKECDLDAHLSVTSKDKTEKLNYFNSDIEDESGTVIAALDVDNEKGDGPETITFNVYDDMMFRFSVASYTALKDSNKIKLSNTGAQVTLYRGDVCIGTYTVDTNSDGNTWCVFEIEKSNLRVCDYSYSVNAITEIE